MVSKEFLNSILPVFLQFSTKENRKQEQNKEAFFNGFGYGSLTESFTGEKNPGDMGPVKNYKPDYEVLRYRSHQCMLESEIAQIVMGNHVLWTIGGGLKLQAEPDATVLGFEGIKVDKHEFSSQAEAYFKLFRKSKRSSYNGKHNLDETSRLCFKDGKVGGDIVVVLRYVDNDVKLQLIDGAHLQNPPLGSKWFPIELQNGNTIENGIEKDPAGNHVRYYIKNRKNEFDIIECIGKKTGFKMAWIFYGSTFRVDDDRGLPAFSSVLETLKKMDRYKEATIGSAEERQKIAFAIEHELGSSGENPYTDNAVRAFDLDRSSGSPASELTGEGLRKMVAKTTNKQAINLPINSKLKILESKNELYFKDFYMVHIDIICACLNIPPEVAMAKYNSNYSASRAAIKAWEHVLMVARQDFATNFYQPVYDFWLHIKILQGKIKAPGYLEAYYKKDKDVLDSYRSARFIGPPVQGIDPLKEVKAEREKLGPAGAKIPLTTAEAATEALGGGEADANILQFIDELEKSSKIKTEEPVSKPGKKKPKSEEE